jgi:hypothetical protein
MGLVIWDGDTSGDWNVGTNWDTGSVPVDGDDVVFDGRDNTQDVTSVLVTQGAIDLASLTIYSTFTKSIGTSDAPLEIEISGDLLIEGTGSYYIQSGSLNGTTDGAIDRTIINTSGNVFLSSQFNDASNQTVFTDVIVQAGTVVVAGSVEGIAKATHPTEAGTVIDNLILSPKNGGGSAVTVTVGEEAFRDEGDVFMNVIMEGGQLKMHSSMLQVDLYGGTITHGDTAYTMTANDDTITTLNMHGGTLKWQPSVVAATIRTTATAAPIITTANIFSGTLDATGMLEKITTAPTITLARLYAGAIFNINNGYAEFIVTTLKDYGGSIQKSPVQALTLS